MIGNDIVDLRQTRLESNWERPRFLDKILTIKEQSFLSQYSNKSAQEKIVWLFWSMKETAYKSIMHSECRRFFNPKLFECAAALPLELQLKSDQIAGSVSYKSINLKVKSEITENYIYSITQDKENYSSIRSNTQTKQKNAFTKSKSTHAELIRVFTQQTKTNAANCSVQKNALGIPCINNNLTLKKTPCSITHHGRYSGICFLTN